MTTTSLGAPVPRTWVNDETLTAADLNTELRDMLDFIVGGCQTTAKRSTTFTLPPNAWTPINWDTLLDDTDGLITVPGTDFTVTRPGVISIRAHISIAGNSTGNRRGLSVFHIVYGGSQHQVTTIEEGPVGSNSRSQFPLTTDIACGAGDILQIRALQTTTGDLGVAAPGTYVVLRWTGNAGTVDDYAGGQAPTPPPDDSTQPPPTPPPTDPDPTRYSKAYHARWSRTYDGDNTTTWDDSAHMFQGYYDSNRGNTRSLAGNFTASDNHTIQQDMVGAVNISMELRLRNIHSYYNSGLTAVVGGHNYSSKPSSITPSGHLAADRLRVQFDKGETKTFTLGSDFVTNLASGNWQGILLGPGPSTDRAWYGYFAGATESSEPIIYVTFYK